MNSIDRFPLIVTSQFYEKRAIGRSHSLLSFVSDIIEKKCGMRKKEGEGEKRQIYFVFLNSRTVHVHARVATFQI